MKENPNIEELLNSFIDGELTQRQQIEVQRLISHDAQVAQRLQELQKCKMLVGSLPPAQAPSDMLERIKTSLEGRTLLAQQPERFDEREGARHLLVRKVLAAAAMIGLIAVLGAVVYTIVAPEGSPEKPVVEVGKPGPGAAIAIDKPIAVTDLAATEFSGRLELKTADFAAVDALISGVIVDNGLLEKVTPSTGTDKSVYTIGCSRESLNLLLADLASEWTRFNWTTLFVETEQFGRQVVVEQVDVDQIAEIVSRDSYKSRIKAAKDFAAWNKMTAHLPGEEVLVAIEGEYSDLTPIPKPRLTSGEKRPEKPSRTDDEKNVHLTIVVIDTE